MELPAPASPDGMTAEEVAAAETAAAEAGLLDLAQEAAAASGLPTALTAKQGEAVVKLSFDPSHSGDAEISGQRIVFGPGSFDAVPGFKGVQRPEPKARKDMSPDERAAADSAWWESGWRTLSLQKLLGFLLAPLAWLMGVPSEDMFQVGQLIGIKSVVNEFVAYLELAGMCKPGAANALTHPRSVVIATYALCGFANLGSIGIQLGGIGGIAPERRSDLAKIGFRAMIAGTIAALLTATVAGMLLK
ncbi:MAG: hypothetical protein KDD82_04165 [Planctomycetes bacterium]|nr:hypothetical protein [Planctomycetota bacterium]